MKRRKILLGCGIAVLAVACATKVGSLSIQLDGEDIARDGIPAGTEGVRILDGWSVNFDSYNVVVEHIELAGLDGLDDEREIELNSAVDLSTLSENGLSIQELDDLDEGRYSFGYRIAPATTDTTSLNLAEGVLETLSNEGLSHWIQGTMTQSGGVSCPPSDLLNAGDNAAVSTTDDGRECFSAESITFDMKLDSEYSADLCEADGISGVAISSGATSVAVATLHIDHLFFNGFPTGDEGGIQRYAQWLADCDLNLDGTVTSEELREIHIEDLPEFDTERYAFEESPLEGENFETALDYIKAQTMTQGHFQGEGECAVNGEFHDHD